MTKKSKLFKNTRKRVIGICLLILTISFISVLARFILNLYNDFYGRTEEFYFYSDRLGEGTGNDLLIYQIENWGGEESFEIEINMSSRKNELLFADYDIAYELKYSASQNAKCTVDKVGDAGIIRADTGKDTFIITIFPNVGLKTGDVVSVDISAHAVSHYDKVLRARFNLVIGHEGVSYQIVDAPHRPYAELIITNTLSYYTVDETFNYAGTTYLKEMQIPLDIYRGLPTAHQGKCYSAVITVGFNPAIVLLDMTNENYLQDRNVRRTIIGPYEYINGFTFEVGAISSTGVRFYKVDPTKDYSFPLVNSTPIIDVEIR